MRQIEEMEHKDKDKAVKTGPWSTQFEVRIVHGNSQVSEKRRFRNACDTGGGETMSAKKAHGEAVGEGGEQLENKRNKCATHKQGGLAGREAVKKRRENCPHNRETLAIDNRQRRVYAKRICKQCGGSSICEHNRQRNQYKQCGGASICV